MTSVAAVIVTYNRKALLKDCLRAVLAQTRAVDAIYLIDNASTDGTPEMLVVEGFLAEPRLRHCRQGDNLGGAGGFARGIELARPGHDWLWLMDDDTIPRPTALAALMRVAERPWHRRPALLASRVEWSDGSLHPMNRVKPLRGYRVDRRVHPIRACSFVSCLVATWAVDEVGLPIAAYRLWMDDVEYTHRLCRDHPGMAVRDSVVEHRTGAAGSVFEASHDRVYLFVRNSLWFILRSPALRSGERLSWAVRSGYTILRMFAAHCSWRRCQALLQGMASGLRSIDRVVR